MHRVTTETLHQAIQTGDMTEVRSLVSRGANIDEVLGLRGTALCAAISAKQESIALFLIDAGCDVNAEDYDREPPLHLSLRKELLTVAKEIIDHQRCNLNKIDPLTKNPAICLAAKMGLLDPVIWLSKAGCNLSLVDADGNSPLHLAVINKNHDIIGQLITYGASLLLCNNQGCNSVHIAAKHGDIKSLQTLFEQWIPVQKIFDDTFEKYPIPYDYEEKVLLILNFRSKFRNETALILAIREGFNSTVKLLLKFGADPNIGGKSNIPPIYLASKKFIEKKINIETIEWLISAGADFVGGKFVDGKFVLPLNYAAEHNSVDLVKLFVKHGADVNYSACRTISPLYTALISISLDVAWFFIRDCKDVLKLEETDAVGRNFLHALVNIREPIVDELVSVLIQGGCLVNGNSTQTHGETPLHRAVQVGNENLTKVLLKHGASANMTLTASGQSPLHIYEAEGGLQIARMLLEAGADLNMKDNDGLTPLRSAIDEAAEEYIDLCKFLLKAGSELPYHELYDLVKFTDTGNSDSSEIDSDCDDSSFVRECPAAIEENDELKQLIIATLCTPPSLQECTLRSIRGHFIRNNISFAKITNLPLPQKCLDQLFYRNC